MVDDHERGVADAILPNPWQTDTCIGGWHYSRWLYDMHFYMTTDQVVKMLLDIVSKNGNLLLNIPVKGDGTIDDDEVRFLQGMAAWMSVTGEAIYGTRPWKIYGENPIRQPAWNQQQGDLTAMNFRFTTKGNVLYATALGWPEDGKLRVRTLASSSPGIVGKIAKVSLVGSSEKLAWTRREDGLVVTLPARPPCEHAYALKIEGLDLAASQPVAPPPYVIRAAGDGLITLPLGISTLKGQMLWGDFHSSFEMKDRQYVGISNWKAGEDAASWLVHFDSPGDYRVSAKLSAGAGATALVVDAGAGVSEPIAVPKTSSFSEYQTVTGGVVKVAAAGDQVVTVRPADPKAWPGINLAAVTLRPAGG